MKAQRFITGLTEFDVGENLKVSEIGEFSVMLFQFHSPHRCFCCSRSENYSDDDNDNGSSDSDSSQFSDGFRPARKSTRAAPRRTAAAKKKTGTSASRVSRTIRPFLCY